MKTPIRTCVACRESSEKSSLTRIVKSPTGEIILDRSGKAPGRGAYLCGKKECLKQAIKYNKLARSLRCEIPQNIISELEYAAVKDNVQE